MDESSSSYVLYAAVCNSKKVRARLTRRLLLGDASVKYLLWTVSGPDSLGIIQFIICETEHRSY